MAEYFLRRRLIEFFEGRKRIINRAVSLEESQSLLESLLNIDQGLCLTQFSAGFTNIEQINSGTLNSIADAIKYFSQFFADETSLPYNSKATYEVYVGNKSEKHYLDLSFEYRTGGKVIKYYGYIDWTIIGRALCPYKPGYSEQKSKFK